jgi:hypothetical protein
MSYQPSTLTNDDLDALSANLTSSTQGPWNIYETVGNGWAVAEYDLEDEPGPLAQKLSLDDALFIAMAKNFLPALIAEVREARAR